MRHFNSATSDCAEHRLVDLAAVLFSLGSLPPKFPIENAIEQIKREATWWAAIRLKISF
jgi:hypothetical protein